MWPFLRSSFALASFFIVYFGASVLRNIMKMPWPLVPDFTLIHSVQLPPISSQFLTLAFLKPSLDLSHQPDASQQKAPTFSCRYKMAEMHWEQKTATWKFHPLRTLQTSNNQKPSQVRVFRWPFTERRLSDLIQKLMLREMSMLQWHLMLCSLC